MDEKQKINVAIGKTPKNYNKELSEYVLFCNNYVNVRFMPKATRVKKMHRKKTPKNTEHIKFFLFPLSI